MKRKIQILFLAAVAVLPLLLLAGCNFFQYFTPGMSGMSSREFTFRGDQYYDQKNYAEALVNYEDALVIDPKNSRAQLGYSRAKMWLSVPDLLLLVTKEMETHPNPIEAVVYALNSYAGQLYLTSVKNMAVFQDIVRVMEGPVGIVNDGGDKVISSESMEVNQILLISYMSLFFYNILDSNKDGVFATYPDYCILTNGQIRFDFRLDYMISNVLAATNVTSGTNQADVLTNLRVAHQASEDVLGFCAFIYLSVDYTTKIVQTILRPATFLKDLNTNNVYPKGGPYTSYYEEFRDAATNTNAQSALTPFFLQMSKFRAIPDVIGGEMSDIHLVITGDAAFTGNIGNFHTSAWDSHTGGLKGVVTADPAMSPATVSNVIATLTNSMTPSDVNEMDNVFSGF